MLKFLSALFRRRHRLPRIRDEDRKNVKLFILHQKQIEIFVLTEEVNFRFSQSLYDQLKRQVDESTVPSIILEISKVRFMDSSAIGALLNIDKAISRKGGFLAIVSPTEDVVESLKIMKLYHVLCIYEEIAEARSFLPSNKL